MKKIYIFIGMLCISLGYFHSSYADFVSDAKNELIKNISAGDKIVQKIDILAKKISDTSKQNDTFRRNITSKISNIKIKYSGSTSPQVKQIYLIIDYLDKKIQSNLGVISTTKFSKRIDKILGKKAKVRTSSRVNKLKTLKYKRHKIRKLKR